MVRDLPGKIQMHAHRKRGVSTVEMCCGILIVLPIALLFFDFCVMTMASQVNDQTCREAARIAATGNPGNPNDLWARATGVINRANKNSAGLLSNFRLIEIKSTTPTGESVIDQISSMSLFGGPVTGTVTVTTEVDMRPFVVKYAYNGQDPIHIRARQSFPFTYMVPNQTLPSK